MLSLKYHNWGQVSDNHLSFEPGIHLLKGASGIGKTSTLQAINFALYGNNCLEHTDQPVVELEYLGLKIRRQKKPERLQVWFQDEHGEDATGQAIIDRVIGSEEQYILGMHIEQRQWNRFFQVTAGERLSLLEGVIGKPAPVEEWLSYLTKEKHTYQGQMLAYDTTLKQLHLPPAVSDTAYRSEEQLSTLEQTSRQIQDAIDKLKSRIAINQERNRQRLEIQQHLATLPPAIDVDESQLKFLFDQRGQLNNELAHTKKMSAQFAKREEILKQLATLGFSPDNPPLPPSEITRLSRQKHIHDIAKKVNTLLQAEFTPQEIANSHSEWREYLTQYTMYNKWLNQVNNISKQISLLPDVNVETLISNHAHSLVSDLNQPCPECGTNLALVNGKLTPAKGTVLSKVEADKKEREYQNLLAKAKQRQQLNNQLLQLQTDAPEAPEEVDVNIDHLKQAIELVTPVLGEMASAVAVDNIDMSKHTKGGQLLKELNTLPEVCPLRSIDLIQRELANVENQIKHIQQQQQFNVKRKLYLDQLQTLTLEDMDQLSSQLTELLSKYDIVTSEINNANAYTEYQQQHEYQMSLKDACDEYSRHIEAIGILEKELVLCQHLYVQQLLDNLNGLFQEITQSLFEEPIIVKLESFKQLKNGKNKPGLNVSITINGITRDTLKKVSQGQADRISLAFTLAITKLTGCKFLLLDEVGSSFNGLRERMFNAIRDYGAPLVILTEHGIETNEYDSIMYIGEEPIV